MSKALTYLIFVLLTLHSHAQKDKVLQENILDRKKMLELVNQVRKEGCQCGDKYMPPVPPLQWDDTLEKASFLHSKDMVQKNYHSHVSLDGKYPNQRVRQLGYSTGHVGENICNGAKDELEAVEGWKSSPGHCENMMRPYWTEMGVGRYKGMWTQMLSEKRKPKSK